MCAKLDFLLLSEEIGAVEFLGIPLHYFSFYQAGMKVNGYRIGDFGYVSDIQKIEPSLYPLLEGVKTLVVSALRPEPSEFHLSFDEAVTFSKGVGAKEVWITHMGHFINHERINESLPPHMRAAYDGLQLEFHV